MTYEEDLRRLLSDAATAIPAGNAPVAELVREGQRSKSRRHLFQAASVAAVVVLILVGAFLVQYPSGGSGNLAAQPTASASGLVVPADTRLVGINGVAVAVPEDWSTNDTHCGFALSDTVDFNETTATRACLVSGTENFSRLHAAPLSSEWGQQWAEPLNGQAVDLQGLVAQRVRTKCNDSQSDAGVTCSGRLIIATANAVMSVNSPNREVVDGVLNSATLIPAGYTAVPDLTGRYTDNEVKPLVESAGLLWENRCPDGHTCEMSPIAATDPAAGSVVPVGTTVRAVYRPDQNATPETPDQSLLEQVRADYIGMDAERATRALADQNYFYHVVRRGEDLGLDTRGSGKGDSGTVVDVRLFRQTEVVLVIDPSMEDSREDLRQEFVGQGVNDATGALQGMGYFVTWRFLTPTTGKTFGTIAEVRLPNPEEVILLVWPPPDCPGGQSPLHIPSGDCPGNNQPIDISAYIGQTAEYAMTQLRAIGAGPIKVRLTGFTEQRCCDIHAWRPTDIVTGIAPNALTELALTEGFTPQGEPLFLHVRASQ